MELGEALRIGPKINKDLTPLFSVAFGAPPSYRRGLLHYVMQQWRHKGQSRNAAFILIAAKRLSTTL